MEDFGWDGSPLGAGERFCSEPKVPGVVYDRIVHAKVEDLPSGDSLCRVCAARFFDHDSSHPAPIDEEWMKLPIREKAKHYPCDVVACPRCFHLASYQGFGPKPTS